MTRPRIIVTGATGKTGSVVVTDLLNAGYPIRAMVHREDGRSARLKAQGAEIAVADMSDVKHIADALKDVQRAYYCPPSNEDIGRVAVAALMDPARHAGKSYRPTGPELLGVEEMAKAVGRAVGRSVRFVPTPTWLFMKGARMSGYPIDLFSGIRY